MLFYTNEAFDRSHGKKANRRGSCMMNDINEIKCESCGAINRLRAHASHEVPVCGKCRVKLHAETVDGAIFKNQRDEPTSGGTSATSREAFGCFFYIIAIAVFCLVTWWFWNLLPCGRYLTIFVGLPGLVVASPFLLMAKCLHYDL